MDFSKHISSPILIYPDHPDFQTIFHSSILTSGRWMAEKESQPINFVVDAQTGIPRSANEQELTEYLEGGEYQLVLDSYGDDEDYEDY